MTYTNADFQKAKLKKKYKTCSKLLLYYTQGKENMDLYMYKEKCPENYIF